MSDIAARLLERLTESDHGHTFPAMRPRDAATMIIVDRATPAPQVLLGRRHHGHKFMPGKFVFPGGRVEPIDPRIPAATRGAGWVPPPTREPLGEPGLLLGTQSREPVRSPGGLWDAFAQAGIAP